MAVGFNVEGKPPTVYVDPDLEDNAYFDIPDERIVVGRAFKNDNDSLLHEYVHYLQFREVPRLTTQSSETLEAIVEAIADYFAASFADDPLLGEEAAKALGYSEPYMIDLKATKNFSPPSGDSRANGEVWSAILWEIREEGGQAVADTIALEWWRFVAAAQSLEPAAAQQSLPRIAAKHSKALEELAANAIARRNPDQLSVPTREKRATKRRATRRLPPSE